MDSPQESLSSIEHDNPIYDNQGCRTTEVVNGKSRVQESGPSKLVLLPPSKHTTIHGIDLEEEDRLYAELMKEYTEDGQVARHHTGAIPRRRAISTPPEPSIREGTRRIHMDTFQPLPPLTSQYHNPTQAYAPFTPIRPRPPRAESIFSSEIYLVDNTISNNPAWSSAPPLFAQDVKIDGWAIVGDGANPRQDVVHAPNNPNAHSRGSDTQPSSPKQSTMGKSQVGSLKKVGSGSGAYVVYDIAITTREGTTMKILRRYSSFEELWEGLMASLATHLHSHIPNLPPKAPFARFRPAFIEKRRQLLEFWLTRVLLHPELGGRKVVKEWVLKN